MKNEAFLYELSKKKGEEIPTPDVVIDAESREDIANTFIPKLSEQDGIAPDLQAELEARAQKVKEDESIARIKENLRKMVAAAEAKSAEARNARIIRGDFDKPIDKTVDELTPLHDPWADEPERR
jgi:hypothetical protein